MERTEVSSSAVRSIGYNAETQVLEVEYLGGGVYQYTNVPASEYEALMSSSSVGKYLQNNIKSAYSARKVS